MTLEDIPSHQANPSRQALGNGRHNTATWWLLICVHVIEQQHVRACWLCQHLQVLFCWGLGEWWWVGDGTFWGWGLGLQRHRPYKILCAYGSRVVTEGSRNFPHSPGLKQEHFLGPGPFTGVSKTWQAEVQRGLMVQA